MKKKLADYRTVNTRGAKGCRVCGTTTVGRVGVTLAERRETPNHQPGQANHFKWPAIDGSSGGYCEEHAVELYELLKSTRDKFDNGAAA